MKFLRGQSQTAIRSQIMAAGSSSAVNASMEEHSDSGESENEQDARDLNSGSSIQQAASSDAAVTKKKKSKKKKKKSATAKAAQAAQQAELLLQAKQDESASRTLKISRAKHCLSLRSLFIIQAYMTMTGKYISSYHGQWLSLPSEILDTLLQVNLAPQNASQQPLSAPLSSFKSASAYRYHSAAAKSAAAAAEALEQHCLSISSPGSSPTSEASSLAGIDPVSFEAEGEQDRSCSSD